MKDNVGHQVVLFHTYQVFQVSLYNLSTRTPYARSRSVIA